MKSEVQPTIKPRDSIPGSDIGRVKGKWSKWLERIEETRETLCFLPTDPHHAHILRNTAHNTARRKGISLNTREVIEEGELRLYIWCP